MPETLVVVALYLVAGVNMHCDNERNTAYHLVVAKFASRWFQELLAEVPKVSFLLEKMMDSEPALDKVSLKFW